ncbi:MAG: IclR family transcriptional regulator [Planctomycetes bacterium]|nr:IclR family transcriptional regulator [Planctomycetota bacterium]MCH9725304.1 IclR family transcriptional regulator [Planctomycetota bacterium]MCH9779476.1 IclR family transcriptional regulator [Planctomycetota bacterium]MCH9792745.1 IclR family transcriptional regulator [Planctomycetota bacterium]
MSYLILERCIHYNETDRGLQAAITLSECSLFLRIKFGMSTTSEATSLGKAFHVLEVMATSSDTLTLLEIVQELGFHKPTVHRILSELVELGYVNRVEKGIYQITPKLRRLALGGLDDRLIEIADPCLRALHDETGETVNLGVLRGTNIRYLRVLESTHPLRRIVEPNSNDPFYSTSLGRAITLQLSDDEWDALIERTRLIARTTETVIDATQLRKIHQRVQQDGFSVEQDQNDVGVTCIGAPVYEEEIIAAISLSVPTARADAKALQRFIKAVVRTARQISKQIQQQSMSKT